MGDIKYSSLMSKYLTIRAFYLLDLPSLIVIYFALGLWLLFALWGWIGIALFVGVTIVLWKLMLAILSRRPAAIAERERIEDMKSSKYFKEALANAQKNAKDY